MSASGGPRPERPSLPERLPAPERWIVSALVRGPEAEFVVGDLLERYRDDLRTTHGAAGARRRLRRQVAGTCWRWWAPGAVRRRRPGGGVRHAGGADAPGWIHARSTAPPSWEGWALDLRFSIRSLARRPALALGVVLTLGLGIGATATIYSVVDTVLLRPLAYDDPGSLVAVGTTFPGREWDDRAADLQHLAGTSYLNFAAFRERARGFEAMGGAEPISVLMPDRGAGPELIPAARATPGFWEALRVSPALGRAFGPEEYRDGGGGAVLLSHGAWVRRFGADPDVLGRALGSMGAESVVVGVLPAGFEPPEALFGQPPEVWMPLPGDHARYADRGRRSMVLLGRLASGVDVAAARRELDGIADRLATEFPDGNVLPDGSHFGAGANGLLEETVGSTAGLLYTFLGGAALLLSIAVLNAATLLLARALDRGRELSVRLALGSGGVRLVRLLVGESVVLSLLGCLVGVALGHAGVAAFHRFGPSALPRMDAVVLDGRVVAVTLAVALGSGLLAGLLPAFRVAGAGPSLGGGRQEHRRVARLREGLVTLQLGIAVLLLSGAGVLFHSFLELRSVEPGFRPDGLVSFRVAVKRPDAPADERASEAWDAVLEELAAVGGVTALAATTNPPFQDPYWAPRVLLPGDGDEVRRDGVAGYAVTPGYFDVVGSRLLEGRDFTRADGPDDAGVIIVNEAWVRTQLGPGQDALGRTVRMSRLGDDRMSSVRIVGVVEDVVQARAEDGARPAVYVPHAQTDWVIVQPVLRSELPLDVLAPEIRRAVARFSPTVPVEALGRLSDRIAATRTDPRFHALLFGAFAGAALLLAAAGLYASLTHTVGRRRRELGVRLALGARRGSVRMLVLGSAARSATAGVGVGLLGALALNGSLARLLFGVRPLDPASLAGAAAVLWAVALLAAYLPARRATAVDPAEVLRTE